MIAKGLKWPRGLSFPLGKKKKNKGAKTEAAEKESGAGEDEPAAWIAVLTVFNIVEAQLTAARLEDEGIPTRIREEAASSAIPVNVGILGMIDLLVPEPMVEKAVLIIKDILDDIEANENEEDDDFGEGAVL